MNPFHHPDFSFPVVRRRLTDELLQVLCGIAQILSTRGWALMRTDFFETDHAYWSALSRLRKAGLVVRRTKPGEPPRLVLSDSAYDRVPPCCRPEKYWKRKWRGYWYVLVYDVPEKHRHFRTGIRQFLTRLRMGCLQKSVWVTPDDIRPDYKDLVSAAGVRFYTYLFESRTVLGQSTEDVVVYAWPFDKLEALQRHFCEACENARAKVQHGDIKDEQLVVLMRQATEGYLAAMTDDPLLPKALWPQNYQGAAAYQSYRQLGRDIAARL